MISMLLGSNYCKDILNCCFGPRDVTSPDIPLTLLLCNPIILKDWNPSFHCAALYFFYIPGSFFQPSVHPSGIENNILRQMNLSVEIQLKYFLLVQNWFLLLKESLCLVFCKQLVTDNYKK